MMTPDSEIIRILRELNHTRHQVPSWATITDAADAIERLSAETETAVADWRLALNDTLELNKQLETAEAKLAEAVEVLEQCQDCIRGETPEDMTDEEAREDTITKIRDIILKKDR